MAKQSLPQAEILETVDFVNNILYEDRTVSEEVGVITMTVFNSLIKSYHKLPFNPVGDGIQVKKGNCPYDYNGVRFQTNWEWYRYSKDKYNDSVINVSAQCNITTKSLTIRISSLEGEYNKSSLYEAIQHEVFHFFERLKRGKPYKNSKYYKVAIQALNELQRIKKENRPYNISKHTLDTCPRCGSKNLDWLTRVIGYLKRISSFSKPRQDEADDRYYA